MSSVVSLKVKRVGTFPFKKSPAPGLLPKGWTLFVVFVRGGLTLVEQVIVERPRELNLPWINIKLF